MTRNFRQKVSSLLRSTFGAGKHFELKSWRRDYMNRYRNLFAPKTKRFLLFFFAISPWISACSENSPLPEPPISVPFSLEDIGSRIEKDFRVVDHNVYYFRLSFAYEDGNQIDRARVKKLMGEHELDKFGNVVRPGVKTPIRLAIFSM